MQREEKRWYSCEVPTTPRLSALLADSPPPMYSGDQPLIACVIGGTALGLMLLVCFWSRRSDRGRVRCRRCGHPFHDFHPGLCIDCGRPRRDIPRMTGWLLVPMLLVLLLAAVAYPGYRAMRWSQERGWTPPLSRYVPGKILRTYSTGHVVGLQHSRNPWDGYTVLTLYPPEGDPIELDARNYAPSFAVDTSRPEDLNNDGIPDLLYETEEGYWTRTVVVALRHGPKPETWIEIENYGGTSLRDIDDDGVPELLHADSGLGYGFAPRCCFSLPEVVQRFDGEEWGVDLETMKRPPPSREQIDAWITKLRALDWSTWPEDRSDDYIAYPLLNDGSRALWERMLALVYEGNGRVAMELHEAVWPEPGNKADARRHFLEVLEAQSSIWNRLADHQSPPVEALSMFQSHPLE